MHPRKGRVVIFLALMLLWLVPTSAEAKEVSVNLVWKFSQSGWLEIQIDGGIYELRQGLSKGANPDKSENSKLAPGSRLQLGWGGWAPIWRLNDGAFQFAPPGLDLLGEGSFAVKTPEGTKVIYRGNLHCEWKAGAWQLTNRLEAEDYLKGVVPIEMSNAWAKDGMEALKAQAVAARTYLVKRTAGGKAITDSPDTDQAYLGKNVEGTASFAVDATAFEILEDAQTQQPIDALYSSHDGGYTEDVKNVWGQTDWHFRSKPDPFSLGVGGAAGSWHYILSAPALGEAFSLGPIRKIDLAKYSSGRVYTVKLEAWDGKTKEVTGKAFVKAFYPFGQPIQEEAFLGSLFEVNHYETEPGVWVKPGLRLPDPLPWAVLPGPRLGKIWSSKEILAFNQPYGVFVFHGMGWGHGVGMSQWGAYHMAQLGYSYKDILAFYYENTTLGKTPRVKPGK